MAREKSTPHEINQLVWNVLRSRGYEKAVREQMVVQSWSEIVGDRIAREAKAVGVENGAVFVHVPNAAWRNELTFLKADLLKKIRDFIGKPVVQDIIFTCRSEDRQGDT